MNKIDIACIIDDDPIFVFGAKKIMQYANFCSAYMIFHNGEEALINLKSVIKAGERLPDIILLDLNMPIMDGWEFLDEFTKIKTSKKITIYIITSSVDPADVERSKEYESVNNYIVKPITLEALQEILNENAA
ncbi:response regulator receiver domain-containing protein [Gillisia mitskevichiae]|uniref:Response regulator receiver domain-containing protein n=1 Tax=Gillisia mitskevichiae TaxID=270921 RepID=A0A495NYU4_9FLAO|nr:response regulator [Gillisia mitskevichiae]RKS42730.1 response regulator receiver domain-containing protein [Gillisia mitskevichiae]